MLDRLHARAVDHLGDDLRAAGHELVALAAHHLDQNGELQLAAAEHLEGVGRAGLFHADGDVGEQLFFEALAQIAAGDVCAFAAGEGRVVDAELDGDGGLVDDDERQRRGVLNAGDGLADGDAFNAGDGDDIAERGFGGLGALEAARR